MARRLRVLRRACGYETVRAFANELGIADNRLSMYELGDRKLPQELILSIKRLTGATSDWLLFGDENNLPVDLYRRIKRAEGLDTDQVS